MSYDCLRVQPLAVEIVTGSQQLHHMTAGACFSFCCKLPGRTPHQQQCRTTGLSVDTILHHSPAIHAWAALCSTAATKLQNRGPQKSAHARALAPQLEIYRPRGSMTPAALVASTPNFACCPDTTSISYAESRVPISQTPPPAPDNIPAKTLPRPTTYAPCKRMWGGVCPCSAQPREHIGACGGRMWVVLHSRGYGLQSGNLAARQPPLL